jgi:hypothetical protein
MSASDNLPSPDLQHLPKSPVIAAELREEFW